MPIKSTTTTEGVKKGGNSKRFYRTSQKTRKINVFLESLLSASFPSLGVTVHLSSLGCPPTLRWSLDLLGGSSGSNLVLLLCSCRRCPQLSELVRFLFWELSVAFHIFRRHRVCLADPVDLICSFTAGGQVWGLLPQPHCPRVSVLVLSPPLHVGRPLGFAPEAALGDLGPPL